MQVNNRLQEESFRYTADKKNMSFRVDDIEKLSDINTYCDKINESIIFNDNIWGIEVEADVELADWVYSSIGTGGTDDRRIVAEILSKQGFEKTAGNSILISLGEWKDSVSSVKEYVINRRKILSKINNPNEYFDFMKSCFIDSCFADDILAEMKHIQNFPDHAEEITKNLAVLNDEAIKLYCRYKNNLKIAIDEISTKLLACSLDPAHRDSWWFSFTYEDIHTDVRCEPHLKLIRNDSDLRIYFYWKDDRIANGKKVLIGRIGRHPWSK